jgi:hypothetical protein
MMELTEAVTPEEEAALRALESRLRWRRRRWALGFAAAWSLQVTLVLLDVFCGWRRELPIHLALSVFTCISLRQSLCNLPRQEVYERQAAVHRVRWEASRRQWHAPEGVR